MNEDTQMNTPESSAPSTPPQPATQPPKPEVPQQTPPEHSGGAGPLAGIIIIILILIFGGYYFWDTKVNEVEETETLPTIQPGGETDAIVNQLEAQGTSDAVGDIESDLNATDLENLDTELDALLNEF